MNVLFVCTLALARSPVATVMFRQLCDDGRHEARSAGTAPDAVKRLSTRELAWADVVAVMEENHRLEIRALWRDYAHKVVVLDVPDEFDPRDPALRTTLAPKLQALLDQLDARALKPGH